MSLTNLHLYTPDCAIKKYSKGGFFGHRIKKRWVRVQAGNTRVVIEYFKGEKPPKKEGDFDPEKTGMVYASKVKKFRRRLRRSIRKQKKKFENYKKKLRRALNDFYGI